MPFPRPFPGLYRSENRTIEKRKKWRQATLATGDEGTSQRSSQLLVRPIRLAGGEEENKTDDAKLRAFRTWDNQWQKH